MKVEKVCNLIKTEVFESKDKTKKFYHAIFVVDDSVVKTMFIKEEDYNLLTSLGHLAEVQAEFNVQQVSELNGVPLFSFRLNHASVFQSEKKSPFNK